MNPGAPMRKVARQGKEPEPQAPRHSQQVVAERAWRVIQ